ncbi:5567_t:CDS:2, partial [Acaulospora morrowiae]
SAAINQKKREVPIMGTPPDYQRIYELSWSDEPEIRPSIAYVHKELARMLEERRVVDSTVTQNRPTSEHPRSIDLQEKVQTIHQRNSDPISSNKSNELECPRIYQNSTSSPIPGDYSANQNLRYPSHEVSPSMNRDSRGNILTEKPPDISSRPKYEKTQFQNFDQNQLPPTLIYPQNPLAFPHSQNSSALPHPQNSSALPHPQNSQNSSAFPHSQNLISPTTPASNNPPLAFPTSIPLYPPIGYMNNSPFNRFPENSTPLQFNQFNPLQVNPRYPGYPQENLTPLMINPLQQVNQYPSPTDYPLMNRPPSNGYPPQMNQPPQSNGYPPQMNQPPQSHSNGYPPQMNQPPQLNGFPQMNQPPQSNGFPQMNQSPQLNGFPQMNQSPQSNDFRSQMNQSPQPNGFPLQTSQLPQPNNFPPQMGQVSQPYGFPQANQQSSTRFPQTNQSPQSTSIPPLMKPPQQNDFPPQINQPPQPNGYSPENSSLFIPVDPVIQKEARCKKALAEYSKLYRNETGYVEPTECHAGYHVSVGDTEGLVDHLELGAKVDDTYQFLNITESLVVITVRYCGIEFMHKILFRLKQYDADFSVVSSGSNKTALHHLFENNSIYKKINESVKENYKKAISFLVENGCNIDALDSEGKTILSYYLEQSNPTLQRKYEAIISILLRNGANPNISVHIRSIPEFIAPNSLFMAVKYNWSKSIFDLLCLYGVNSEERDNSGYSILVLTMNVNQIDRLDKVKWVLENVYAASEMKDLEMAMKMVKHSSKEYDLLKMYTKKESAIQRKQIIDANKRIKVRSQEERR